MKFSIATVLAALISTSAAQAEKITFRTVDFKMPDGIEAPRGVKKQDIFVSSENCYYYRKDLNFIFIGCVG